MALCPLKSIVIGAEVLALSSRLAALDRQSKTGLGVLLARLLLLGRDLIRISLLLKGLEVCESTDLPALVWVYEGRLTPLRLAPLFKQNAQELFEVLGLVCMSAFVLFE